MISFSSTSSFSRGKGKFLPGAVFLSSLLFSLCFCGTAEEGEEKKKPLLPVLNIDLGKSRKAMEEQAPEKVVIDRSNIAVLERADKNDKAAGKQTKTAVHRMMRWTKRPKNSLAAKLAPAVKAVKIHWFPRLDSSYANGTDVEDGKLSPDRSVIAFLEKLGNAPGPYGTRIVLYDTHAWEILQAQDLEEVYAKKCVWLDSGKLALFCSGQKSRKTRDSIALYDPLKRRIISRTPIGFSVGKTMFSDEKDTIFLTEPGAGKIHRFRLENDGTFRETDSLEDFSGETAFAASNDGKNLYFCDEKFSYVYGGSDEKIAEKIRLPEGVFKIHALLPLNTGAFLLLPEYASGLRALYFKGDRAIPLGNPSSGMALPGIMKDSFFAGFSKGCEFGVYHKKTLEQLNLFSANNIRPRTQGTVLFAFSIPHAGAVAVLDSQGIVYLLYPNRSNKRYLKEVLTKKLQ
ncbi:MAG: hypothetical protein J6A21_03770 [Lentisphaeria bacterium]|nr:hypothetical protein [Lentisphaeria bacterium]